MNEQAGTREREGLLTIGEGCEISPGVTFLPSDYVGERRASKLCLGAKFLKNKDFPARPSHPER